MSKAVSKKSTKGKKTAAKSEGQDLSKLTVAQLKKMCDEKNFKYSKTDKKADLIKGLKEIPVTMEKDEPAKNLPKGQTGDLYSEKKARIPMIEKMMKEEVKAILKKNKYTQKQINHFIKENQDAIGTAADELCFSYEGDFENVQTEDLLEYIRGNIRDHSFQDLLRAMPLGIEAAKVAVKPAKKKVSPKAKKSKPKKSKETTIYLLFDTSQFGNSSDPAYELDYAFAGAFRTKEAAFKEFAGRLVETEAEGVEESMFFDESGEILPEELSVMEERLEEFGWKLMEETLK